MAVSYFLKLESATQGVIQGESKSSTHPNEIEVISWEWGATVPREGGSRELEEFTFVHRLDKSSPKLLLALATNQVMKATLNIELLSSPPRDYATYEMTNGFVTGVHPAAGSSQKPVEEVSLVFRDVTLTYRPLNPNGTLGSPIVGSISAVTG